METHAVVGTQIVPKPGPALRCLRSARFRLWAGPFLIRSSVSHDGFTMPPIVRPTPKKLHTTASLEGQTVAAHRIDVRFVCNLKSNSVVINLLN